jgi:hypothetical protein
MKIMSGKNYRYKLFTFANAIAFTRGVTHPDAYFAQNSGEENKEDWDAALADGYRWVRTEHGLAILEKETENR